MLSIALWQWTVPINRWICSNAVAFFIHRDVGHRKGKQKDYMPTMWNEHFDEKEDILLDNNQKFRIYFSKRDRGNKKPLLVLLHGGGYSALTWAHFSVMHIIISLRWMKHPLISNLYFYCTEWNNSSHRLSMFGHRFKGSRWYIRLKWIGFIS